MLKQIAVAAIAGCVLGCLILMLILEATRKPRVEVTFIGLPTAAPISK